MEKVEDLTNYDALALRAERGELKTLRRVYDGDGSRVDLAEIFLPTGRPRMDETTARRTWKTRVTDELDDALTQRARQENVPKAVLIRKATRAYLANA